MSKMGQWIFELQQDAMEMNFSQFVEKHGYSAAEIWQETRFGTNRFEDVSPEELEREAMAEGFYGS